MLMGRPDSGVPDTTAGLPSPCDESPAGIARFATMGFTDPTTALVVLSGAHNIGASRVTPNTGAGSCSKGLVSFYFFQCISRSRWTLSPCVCSSTSIGFSQASKAAHHFSHCRHQYCA